MNEAIEAVYRSRWYVLEGREARPASGSAEAERHWSDRAARIVARTRVGRRLEVSTVFLAFDHAHGGYEPILFETMIFGRGPMADSQWRYATYLEAEVGHQSVVRELYARTEAWKDLRALRRTFDRAARVVLALGAATRPEYAL